jgi:hypothetical protein
MHRLPFLISLLSKDQLMKEIFYKELFLQPII